MKKYGILNDAGEVIARFVTPLSVRSNVPVLVSDALSLKRKVRKLNSQRWEIDANLEPLTQDAVNLGVHLVTHGLYKPLSIIVPQPYRQPSAIQGPKALLGIYLKGSYTVYTEGVIPASCFVKFSNHSKVYMVVGNLPGGGLTVFPALLKDVSGSIYFEDDVVMSCLYDTGTVTGSSYTDGILMNTGTVKLVERISYVAKARIIPTLDRFYVDSPVKATETTNYAYIANNNRGRVITIVNLTTLATLEYITPRYGLYDFAVLGAADGDNLWFAVGVDYYNSYLTKITPAGRVLESIHLAYQVRTMSRVGDYLLMGTAGVGGSDGKVYKLDLSGTQIAAQTGGIFYRYDIQGEIIGHGVHYWAYATQGISLLKLDANLVQIGYLIMPESVFGIIGIIGDNIYLNGGGGFYRVNVVTDMITFFAIPVSSGVTTHFRAAGIDGSLLIISSSYGLYTEGLWFFDTATETFTREAVMVDDSINHFAVGYGWKRNGVYYALDVSGNYVILFN